MSRVYLAFLGTNDYLPCTYFKDDSELRDVRFVQEATLLFFCQEWTRDDRILIFTTDEAARKNWQDEGHKDRETKKPLKRKGLKKCIEDLNLSTPYESVPIPEGKSEQEIWDIFGKVFGQLNQCDEVVFDITHAFRSIPMLAIVVLNYAKVMKDITLQGISCGAFEVLGSIHQTREMPLDKRRVPILDLTAFDVLMDWSFAVDRFLGAGDAVPACSLASRAMTPILRETEGQHRDASFIRTVAKKLQEFSITLSTCRGLKISGVVSALKEQMSKTERIQVLPPFHPLFERIKAQMDLFKGDIILDGIQAARWCLQHNLIQQGYTILQEILVTHFVIKVGENPEKQENRDIASQAVTIHLKDLPEIDWRHQSAKNPVITRKFLRLYQTQDNLVEVFNQLSNCRNDLNHAGHRSNAMGADRFREKLSELLDKAERHIKIS